MKSRGWKVSAKSEITGAKAASAKMPTKPPSTDMIVEMPIASPASPLSASG